MKTGLTKQEKTTEIWFDEKEPIIYIKTHNTNLKNRLVKYSHKYPAMYRWQHSTKHAGTHLNRNV